VPNLSGFYHDILRAWWEIHGLGVRCLLVSETRAVARVFQGSWPGTRFVTTDLHVELQSQPECDFVWDLCSTAPPDGHREAFSSVICQATLEHVLDPVQALRNLAGVLHPGGMLYVQTHTSAYPYHGYPRDHLRYFPDWFQDVGDLLGTLSLVELLCVDGHAFAAYRRR
jgi:SAM-dependent methyltransferase